MDLDIRLIAVLSTAAPDALVDHRIHGMVGPHVLLYIAGLPPAPVLSQFERIPTRGLKSRSESLHPPKYLPNSGKVLLWLCWKAI